MTSVSATSTTADTVSEIPSTLTDNIFIVDLACVETQNY